MVAMRYANGKQGLPRGLWPAMAMGLVAGPALAFGAGSLILVASALQRKSWPWWVIGAAIAVVALFFLRNEQRGDA